MKTQKAFTLIELLVVIAIVGLLSAIVVVSVKTAKNQAKTGASKQFSATTYHALGAYIMGNWSFDSVSGATVTDDSGNKQNGTIVAPAVIVSGGINKNALNLNSTGYVTIPNFTAADTEITIEAWTKPINNSGSMVIVTKGSSYMLVYSPWDNAWIFEVALQSAQWPYVYGYVDHPTTTEWHHIAATYKDTKFIKVYYDGKILPNNGDINLPAGASTIRNTASMPVVIGSDIATCWWWCSSYNGLIDEVKIYKSALGQSEIYRHYVEGAIKRGLTIKQ